ncbi:rhamnogalacturonan acetylesterase [Nonomuraea rhodomycinica]|uniref:Rhamnogalacturonan acetylesterase n=1 Tax=Nonomuraea rhodomycinica TaxID=1712872 RepID=A0A7Y6M901_9ACTN|nr:rhamnogalacturonan acetylesterase [Nonomuraea rhodomycinica]NUW39122.1 rhamnogalacturonan acetylesterase [Nonomuraea rhodomycinica]
MPEPANEATVRTFDVPPGHYDVTVVVRGGTEVLAEARRLMARASPDGGWHRRTFTVNVRTPEAQQNGWDGPGTPGLTLTFTGATPEVRDVEVRAVEVRDVGRAPGGPVALFLAGDSTVTDQAHAPYTGWGQRLPRHFGRGLSVVNHSGSSESAASFLAKPELWAAMEPQVRPGDVALIQFGHNDKQATAAAYRDNLTRITRGITARGGTPVLVTPIVRRRFDGAALGPTGLIVNERGVDLPAEMRAVAAAEGVPLIDLTDDSRRLVEALGPQAAEELYLTREKQDDTHTSEHGATIFADLVAAGLRRLGLVADRFWAP